MYKSSKEGSFKSRIIAYYGQNNGFYKKILQYRQDWGNLLFYVDESLVKANDTDIKQLTTLENDRLNIKELEFEETDFQYVNNIFISNLKIDLKSNNETHGINLEHEQAFDLKPLTGTRNAHLLSVGGTVVSQQWLPRPVDDNSGISYLAVSIFNNPKGIQDMFNPELRLYSKIKSNYKVNSAIQIWEYNLNSNEIQLRNVLLTTALGLPIDIKWVPIYSTSNVLGVLSGNFTGGTIDFFKIAKDHPKYTIIKTSSFSYTSTNEFKKSKDNSKITAYDFMGFEKILVGTDNGSVAEFKLPFDNSESQEELNVPNFKSNLGDSSISSILCAETKIQNEFLNIIHTQNHKSFEYHNVNPMQDIFTPLSFKSVTKPTFNWFLQSYVGSSTVDSNNYANLKMPMDSQSTLIKGDFIFTCSEASSLIGHPLLLFGGANGDIFIINYLRRISNQKISHKFSVPLKLWKLQFSEERKISLSADFEKAMVENPAGPSILAPEVNISSLSWNDNVIGSSVYSAGTSSGLLIIERLDPQFL